MSKKSDIKDKRSRISEVRKARSFLEVLKELSDSALARLGFEKGGLNSAIEELSERIDTLQKEIKTLQAELHQGPGR